MAARRRRRAIRIAPETDVAAPVNRVDITARFRIVDLYGQSREEKMTMRAEPVGPQRYRASYGRYLEDFTVGDIYEHRPGRTITEADNIQFSLLTMNSH